MQDGCVVGAYGMVTLPNQAVVSLFRKCFPLARSLLACPVAHPPRSHESFRERVYITTVVFLSLVSCLHMPCLVHSQARGRQEERCYQGTAGRHPHGPRRGGPSQDSGARVGDHRAGLRRRLQRLPKSGDETGVRRRRQGVGANGIQAIIPQGGPAERQCSSVDARGELEVEAAQAAGGLIGSGITSMSFSSGPSFCEGALSVSVCHQTVFWHALFLSRQFFSVSFPHRTAFQRMCVCVCACHATPTQRSRRQLQAGKKSAWGPQSSGNSRQLGQDPMVRRFDIDDEDNDDGIGQLRSRHPQYSFDVGRGSFNGESKS